MENKDMKKIAKILIIIFSAIVIIALAAYLLYTLRAKNSMVPPINNNAATSTKYSATSSPMTATTSRMLTEQEKNDFGLYHLAKYEVIGEREGKPVIKLIGLDDPKPIKFEAMDEKTKAEKGFATSTNIQILRRNSKGEIAEYRLMKDANDILKEY